MRLTFIFSLLTICFTYIGEARAQTNLLDPATQAAEVVLQEGLIKVYGRYVGKVRSEGPPYAYCEVEIKKINGGAHDLMVSVTNPRQKFVLMSLFNTKEKLNVDVEKRNEFGEIKIWAIAFSNNESPLLSSEAVVFFKNEKILAVSFTKGTMDLGCSDLYRRYDLDISPEEAAIVDEAETTQSTGAN